MLLLVLVYRVPYTTYTINMQLLIRMTDEALPVVFPVVLASQHRLLIAGIVDLSDLFTITVLEGADPR